MKQQDIWIDYDDGVIWKYTEPRIRNGERCGGISGWKCHGNQTIESEYHRIRFNGKLKDCIELFIHLSSDTIA